jgi:hypothetical protein
MAKRPAKKPEKQLDLPTPAPPATTTRSGEMGAAVVIVGLGVISLVLWARLLEWRFGEIDPLSSVGLLIVAAVVGVGFLVEWFQDWRILRALRFHLAKARAQRKDMDPRGPKGK